MNLAVSNWLIPGLRDKMSNGPTMHFFKTNDSRDKEGIIYVRESLDKGQVNTKKVVSLSALFTDTQKFHSEDTGAKWRKML